MRQAQGVNSMQATRLILRSRAPPELDRQQLLLMLQKRFLQARQHNLL